MKVLAEPASRSSGNSQARLDTLFSRLGLRREIDFALHLPLRYEDETRVTPLREAAYDQAVQLKVRIEHSEVTLKPRRQLICRARDVSEDPAPKRGNEWITLRFLHFYPSQQRLLNVGAELLVFGELREGYYGAEMVHPRLRPVNDATALPTTLTPIYPTTAGLSQPVLRRRIAQALTRCDLSETVPEAWRERLHLAPFADSLRLLHTPPAGIGFDLPDADHPARRRIAFDELLAQQLSLRRARAARREHQAPVMTTVGPLSEALLAALPFRLTAAQQRVWQEIVTDLAQPHPMQRLLQGDVGSGKTVIAALAMLRAAENGYQAALMAPTEILAEQHYRKLQVWLEPLGVPVIWLTGSLKASAKRQALAALASGEVLLAVGTHALIEEAVDFARLGLTIVDEQHRFGVRQRLTLRQKGAAAHQLTMSATPIPRTLAMSYYADLDVSVIDELPPGRSPVLTRLYNVARRDEIVAHLHAACRSGRQAYWVCPLIEESETLDLQNAIATRQILSAAMPDLAIGLLHGRLTAEEKASVMARFVSGELHVLVATTVIEVGVDVPNASLMIIEHAERFGLAQLHQLRGRVGRGSTQSVCVLLYAPPLSSTARERLHIIRDHQDGFEIARHDLLLRGPGEFVGARQSGLPLLRFASLDDDQLIEQVRTVAESLLREHPERAEAHLERWLSGREELLKA